MVSVSALASLPASFNRSLVSQLLIDGAGDLFTAVSSQDGVTGRYTGTVFELVRTPAGYAPGLTSLASFSGRINSLTADAAGNLFGVYARDSSSPTSSNTIFEVPKTALGYGPLVALADPGAGSSYNIRLDSAGDIIGIATSTYNGVGYVGGRVFELAKTPTGYAAATTTLYAFAMSNASTASLALDAADNIFFVAPGSGGQIQELAKTTGGWSATPLTILAQNSGGPAPVYGLGGLTIASDGDLFVQASGAGDREVVLYLDKTGAGATGYAPLIVIDSEIAQYGFANVLDAPLLDANGDVFLAQPDSGLMRTGASYNSALPGVIVHVTSTAGAYAALDPAAPSSSRAIYAFSAAAGATGPGFIPRTNLVADGSGVLYGVTITGGANDAGTIYQVSGSGYAAAPSAAGPTLTLPATYNGAVNDSGASASDRLTNVARPTVTGVASQRGATVTLYDSDGTTVLGAAVADAATGAYAITAAALADGVHQLTVVSTQGGAASARSAVLAVTIDTTAPTITGLAYGPNDGDLGVGEAITLVYSFSEPVTQTPSAGTNRPAPTLTLSSGATLTAPPAGLGTATLTYTYTPAAGQSTPDLAVTGANLNGGPPGFFNDAAGNPVASSPLGDPPGVVRVDTSTPAPANTAPTIAGAQAGQADTAGLAINPFSQVTVTDPDANQAETVTVSFPAANGTLSGGGFVQTAPGVYSVAAPAGAAGASAAAAQADLRAAVFTPTAGQSATTTFTVSVNDGQAPAATDSTTSVVATYTPLPPPTGGATVTTTPPSVQYGLQTQFQNLSRALAGGADALNPATPVYAALQVERAVASQLDGGQVTLAQAEATLQHLVDGTTAVAVATYGFFTGYTPTAAGLTYLVHSGANATDLNDAYYARFSTENRYINFAVNLATGPGAGASAFQASYGALSLADATAKAYAAVFGAPADATKVSALLNALVPDGLGGQETRARYFAQYGGDGPNGQGTKAAMIGFLLSNAVHDGSGVYGAATEHYLAALAHGTVPATGSELALTYGAAVNLVGLTPMPDFAITG